MRYAASRISDPNIASERAQLPLSTAGILGEPLRLALVIALLAFAWLTFASPAHAAFDHSVELDRFTVSECGQVNDIAIDEPNELIYAACAGGAYDPSLRRFDFAGNPVPFTATEPYLEFNEITEAPADDEHDGALGNVRVAIDNSSVHPGYIFLAGGPSLPGSPVPNGFEGIEIFKPNGEFVFNIGHPNVLCLWCDWVDLDIDDSNGSMYAKSYGSADEIGYTSRDGITKFDAGFRKVAQLYPLDSDLNTIRLNSEGAVWAIEVGEQVGNTPAVSRWEADQFKTNLDPTDAELVGLRAVKSPLFSDPLLQSSSLKGLDVDPTNDDLYVDRGTYIDTYSRGTPEEAPYRNAPSFGSGILTNSLTVAVARDHRVFASDGADVVTIGVGNILPDVHTYAPAQNEVGHTTAILNGQIDPAGGSAVTSCALEYGTTDSYGSTAPCTPDPASSPPGSNFTTPTSVSAAISGLTTGQTYHYRFVAENIHGANVGIDRTVVPAFVLGVQTLPAVGLSDEGAILRASLDPDNLNTTYHFEYGRTTGYGLTTPETGAGSTPGLATVQTPIGELASGQVFHFRVVASNENGSTVGRDRTFRTASPPDITGVRATELSATSAVLRARINPNGYDTTYHFEYGQTSNYGQAVPIGAESVGPGSEPVEIDQLVSELQVGTTYHFRLVAENAWGTTATDDNTFEYFPPNCPNDHVRQQTGASRLPDCRAYELVSPGSAGAIVLLPGEQLWHTGPIASDINAIDGQWPQNTGYATSPSRFGYWGAFGALNGIDSVGSLLELYVATRTPQGWVSTLPGQKGSEVADIARTQCDDVLSKCLNHRDIAHGFFADPPVESAPIFTVQGEKIDLVPTNVDEVSEGEHFEGSQRMARDFTNFAFSSSNVAFTPDGKTGGLGSAYDNDLTTRSLSVISLDQNHNPIEQDGGPSPYQRFWFPAVSTDGSHILMENPSSEGGYHLYLRVADSVTYDVARGAGVEFVGMTRDGSTVAFIAKQQLTPDDTDTSTDLYVWHEAGDMLDRVSQGDGNGDSDACSTSFTAKCDVSMLDLELDHPRDWLNVPGIDDNIAEGSGDVYFYSPENLDPTRRGIKNERNLYVYRNGEVQLVSVMDPGTSITRMQISPDGVHTAMISDSQMTSYDSNGFKQMYTYNASTRTIRCASCKPSGAPPLADVRGSNNGRFMADDGRTFFSTTDSLVPTDTNGKITDVYEYVDGRPQMLTSGQASQDFTGGKGTLTIIYPGVNTGLESVSRDGTDVYFSTFETFVPQDQNGAFVKFYDARTGGGIPVASTAAPCAAADECHGADSSLETPPTISTGGVLGGGGNVTKRRAKTCRHRNRPHRLRGRKSVGKRCGRKSGRSHSGRAK